MQVRIHYGFARHRQNTRYIWLPSCLAAIEAGFIPSGSMRDREAGVKPRRERQRERGTKEETQGGRVMEGTVQTRGRMK